MLFDTHAHLDDERFAADFDAMLERMRRAGVMNALAVATTRPSAEACLKLAAAHEMLYASVGIHPNHAKTDVQEDGVVKNSVVGNAGTEKDGYAI